MGTIPPPPPGQGPDPEHSAPIPEILPPVHGPAQAHSGYSGGGYTVAPPPRPRRKWAVAPATYTLLAANCAVFVLMFLSGSNPFNPSGDSLIHWGADHAGKILLDGQWWRILTAMFVHGGLLHLGLNMWCLWNLGMLAEPLMGSFGVIAVYLLTGAAGNLLSTFRNFEWPPHDPTVGAFYPVGVGASGAIFGIAGALIILLKSTRLPVPPDELKKLRKSVIYFAAINLIIGFSINVGTSAMGAGIGVDNMAHVGGFASGLLFAVPMVPRIGSPRRTFNLRLRAAVGLVAGILILFGFYLAQLPR